jgi:hypothetical protein
VVQEIIAASLGTAAQTRGTPACWPSFKGLLTFRRPCGRGIVADRPAWHHGSRRKSSQESPVVRHGRPAASPFGTQGFVLTTF